MTIFEELKARGLIFQTTDEEALVKAFEEGPVSFTPVMTQQQTVSTLDTSSLSLLVVAFNWLATNLTPSLGVRQV